MKNLLKRIILDFHNRPLPPFKKRHADVPPDIEKIITIIGPRRAGKTYYLFQIMDKLGKQGIERKRILYLNLEDERIELNGNYDLIIESYLELYPDIDIAKSYLFFDEIQELHGWEKFIRRLQDTHTKHIFLTGSNSKLLSKEIATSLRGRSISFEIFPLSFSEFLDFKGIDSKDTYSTRNASAIGNAFEDYLLWGGYPELTGMDSHLKAQVMQEYFNVMIYRDLTERYGTRDVSILKYLIKRLISSFTKEFSVNKLYNDLKSRGLSISKNHIYKTVEQIFSVYMLANVEKYDPSVIKREMSNKKVFLYDNGLVSAASYSPFEDRGKLMENLVFSHLRRSAEDIFFMKNGWECDFLTFQKGDKPLLIQVTNHLNQDNYRREIKGLENARKKIPDAETLLISGQIDKNLAVPEWITTSRITDWLLA